MSCVTPVRPDRVLHLPSPPTSPPPTSPPPPPRGRRAGSTQLATVGHDRGNQRFSTVARIAPANIAQLRRLWAHHSGIPHSSESSSGVVAHVAMAALLMWSSVAFPNVMHAQGHASAASSRAPDRRGAPRVDALQPTAMPALPQGMTLDMIREGDALFHARAGCFACHGTEGEGLSAAGDGFTVALVHTRPEWHSIDSLITAGIPDALTRSPIAMPPRGARSDLTDDEISRVSAYVWALNQVQGEPWPGGHASHAGMVPPGSTHGTAPARPWRSSPAPSPRTKPKRDSTRKSP